MDTIFLKLKKAVIIGFTGVVLSTAFSSVSEMNSAQCWFITGESIIERTGSTMNIVSDKVADVEFGFGILDFFKNLFS